jgi:hypothetical protein
MLYMIPGVTTQDRAEEFLAAYTTKTDLPEWEYRYQVIGNDSALPLIGLQYTFSDSPRHVEWIRVTGSYTASRGFTTIGDFIAAGYELDRMLLSSYSMGPNASGIFIIVFGTTNRIIAIVRASGFLGPSSPVTDIYILGGELQDQNMEHILGEWRANYEIRWRGFTFVRSYLRAAGIK